jgi:hypothetical protein
VDLNPTSMRHTLEWLGLGLRLAYRVLQPVKHYLGCPRPAHYAPGIQPVIRPRRFLAFPSGHATEAFMMARLLAHLAGVKSGDELDSQLQRMATRIANNRVVAGVHFHIDSVAGRMVGESLAEYYISRCGASERGWVPREFNGKDLDDETDQELLRQPLNRCEVIDNQAGVDPSSKYFANNKKAPITIKTALGLVVGRSEQSLLGHLWSKVAEEWK